MALRCPTPAGALAAALAAAVAAGLLVAPAGGAVRDLGATAAVDHDPSHRRSAVQGAIEEMQDSLAGTSAQLQEAYGQLRETQAALEAAQARLAEARRVVAEATALVREREEELAVARAEEELARADVEEGLAAEEETRSVLGAIARQAYRSAGAGSGMDELSLALDAASPQDFADRVVAVDTALRGQNDVLGRLAARQADNRARSARLEAVRERVAELKRLADEALGRAREAEARQAAAEQEAARASAAQEAVVATIRSRQAEERARLAQLEREAAELDALIRRLAEEARARAAAEQRAREQAAARAGRSAPPREAAPPVASDGRLARPAPTRITSSFGWRVHPIYGVRRLHRGTDFGGPCGTSVVAAEDGVVVAAGYSGGAGNRIVVDHGVVDGRSLVTVYMHLQSFDRTSGRVSRGEVIGRIGTTGASTGCHLHFETHVDGTPVDPMGWL